MTETAQPPTPVGLTHDPSLFNTLALCYRHTTSPVHMALTEYVCCSTLLHNTPYKWLPEGTVPVTKNSLPPQRAHVQLRLPERFYFMQPVLLQL